MHKGQKIVNKRILLVQRTLTIYKFLSQKGFPKSCRKHGDKTLKNYMSLFKEVIEWKDKIAIGKKTMSKNINRSKENKQ